MADDSMNGNAAEEKRAKVDYHIKLLVEEKKNLHKSDNPIALRLLDEELKRTQDAGYVGHDNRYLDVYNDRITKVKTRVKFPAGGEVPPFNFVGKLLGPKGNTLKHLQEHTKCKMFIFGRGSMRDKAKEDELRESGDMKYAHLAEELHVEVSCVAPPAEAYTRIAHALQELRLVLTPDNPVEDPSYGYVEDYPMMHPGLLRGAYSAPTSKVMGFLEKARQSMDYQPSHQPRRYGHSSREESYFGDEGRWVSGYKASGGGGGGHYTSRSAPYSRP